MNNGGIPKKNTSFNWNVPYKFIMLFAAIVASIYYGYPFYENWANEPNLQGTVWPLICVLNENNGNNLHLKINNNDINDLYMRQVRVKNEGKNDIENLDVSYVLSPDGLTQDMDKNLNIYASISNSSPSPTISNQLSSDTKNSRDYTIPHLSPGTSISVLLLFNKEDNILVYPSASKFNAAQDFHNYYVA